jgi:hypothetical protein
MRHLTLIAALLTAPTAFATGERISLGGAAVPLKAMLCISMSCTDAGPSPEFLVTGRAGKEGIEFTVTSPSGQSRLTHQVSFNSEGEISSTDWVHTAALVVKSIEQGPIPRPAAAEVKRAKHSKRRAAKVALAKR